jgi:hypothetical protein
LQIIHKPREAAKKVLTIANTAGIIVHVSKVKSD